MDSKTPVSLLQEILVQRSLPLPQYSIITLSHTVTPEFQCTVTTGNVTATAKAYSKKEAKHRSADMMLKKLGITDLAPGTTTPVINTSLQYGNSVGKLNELASRNGLPYPQYITECSSHNCLNLVFATKCRFGSLETFGTAPNKKDAKQKAATEMLLILKDTDLNSIYPKGEIILKSNDTVTTSAADELAEKLYKQLAFNQNEKDNSKVQKKLDVTKLSPVEDYELNTIEEVKAALEASEVEYTVEKFQSKPLILMLQIKDTKQVIMEIGEVYEKTAHGTKIHKHNILVIFGKILKFL